MSLTRIGGQDVRDEGLTDQDVSAANKDGLPTIPSLRTLGTGSQQAAAGDDPRLAYPTDYFKHAVTSSSPPGPRWYVAGKVAAGGGTTTQVTKNVAYFMPFRTTTEFVLMGAGVANTNAPGPAQVNMGLYDSIAAQDLHPNNLIAQLGVTPLSSIGPPFLITGLSLALASNAVYWLAVVFGGGGPQISCRTLDITNAEPILGLPPSLSGNEGIGYTMPLPIGAFPSTVAPASTTLITGNGTPFLVYNR